MAETGASRPKAMEMAREMVGVNEGGDLRLPETERPLIDLMMASVGLWRIASGLRVVRLGFDWSQIDVKARWMGITPDRRMERGIGIIEREALRIMESKT
ncbi:MAG: hypothetical protein IE938_19215 [Pseudomonas balearica]|nr:hypothetical protein [Stutzerimonas balearica]